MSLEKLFVPYELAKELKEKGFKEECLGFWEMVEEGCRNNYNAWAGITEIEEYEDTVLYLSRNELESYYSNIVRAPTWQQVTDWLREKHDIECTCIFLKKHKLYVPFIWVTTIMEKPIKFTSKDDVTLSGKTYTEALEICIKEALKLMPVV